MPEKRVTRAIALNGTFFEQQADGSLRPLVGETDWERLKALSEAEIEAAALNDEDNPPISNEQWQRAVKTHHKKYIHIGIDDDILGWFKSSGDRGYQTKINAVLRQYVEAQQKAGR